MRQTLHQPKTFGAKLFKFIQSSLVVLLLGETKIGVLCSLLAFARLAESEGQQERAARLFGAEVAMPILRLAGR